MADEQSKSIMVDVTTTPRDLVDQILEMGRIEWGAVQAKTDEGHILDFTETLRITRENFGVTEPTQELHGLYLEGTETVLAHTGTSPNSPKNARVIAGLWNSVHDALLAAKTENATSPTAMER